MNIEKKEDIEKQKISKKIVPIKIIFNILVFLFLLFIFVTLFILPDIGSNGITQGPLIGLRAGIVKIIALLTFNKQPDSQKWILTIITSLFGLISSVIAVIWHKKLNFDKKENIKLSKDDADNKENEIIKSLKGWKRIWYQIKPFLFFAFLIALTIIFPDILIQIRVLIIITCVFLSSFELINLLEKK